MPTGCLVYDETESRRSAGFIPYDRVNATGGFIRHFGNQLYLEFIAGNPDATWAERQQAEKELLICKRKMAWHSNHPNFSQSAAEAGMAKIKRDWGR